MRVRIRAAYEWSALLGDTSSCALAKDGRSHPAAKFAEGKAAALGELLRRVADDTDPGGIVASATAVKIRWSNQPIPVTRPDRDWEAYRAGGIQALTELSSQKELTEHQGTAS
ncbi:hypothetical protein E3T37_15595 [Cryobacterium sp. TMT2-10]|nr:hypothetical protein [Cryobacterium sp. TMT2-10]TFD35272.1 hypothetical protein E3T37_15595 [Cryobacterium sp. TMT2-10]